MEHIDKSKFAAPYKECRGKLQPQFLHSDFVSIYSYVVYATWCMLATTWDPQYSYCFLLHLFLEVLVLTLKYHTFYLSTPAIQTTVSLLTYNQKLCLTVLDFVSVCLCVECHFLYASPR